MDSREQDVNQKGATDSAFRKARIDAMVAPAGKVMVFPQAGPGNVPRHPSQLYQAGLEGLLLFVLLSASEFR